MSSHFFSIFMLGMCCGFLLLMAIDRISTWYWNREKQDEKPLDVMGGEDIYNKSNATIVVNKPKTLKDKLKEALANEDYETAAKLRDKINKQRK